MNPMLARTPRGRKRYEIFQCARCRHRVWDKENKRVGWCKASGKPAPLIDDGESLTRSINCTWFELDKKMAARRREKKGE